MNDLYDEIKNKNGQDVFELFIRSKPKNLNPNKWMDELIEYDVFNDNHYLNEFDDMNIERGRFDEKYEILTFILNLARPVYNKLSLPILHKLLSGLNFTDILDVCKTNKELYSKVCNNEIFWLRLMYLNGNDGFLFIDNKPTGLTYIQWITELMNYGIYDNNFNFLKKLDFDQLEIDKKINIINYIMNLGYLVQSKSGDTSYRFKLYK